MSDLLKFFGTDRKEIYTGKIVGKHTFESFSGNKFRFKGELAKIGAYGKFLKTSEGFVLLNIINKTIGQGKTIIV